MIDISVIIPSYKPRNYIRECLDRIYNQSLPHERYEVIIILNGCGDPWNSQIQEWIDHHQDMNIKYIVTPMSGVSNARNIGIDQSGGKYITFIDDDDYVSNSYLEDLLNSAEENTIVLSNTVSFIDGEDRYNENYSLRKVYDRVRVESNISLIKARSLFNGPCMKLIPRQLIDRIRFNPTLHNGEDSLFMFEVSMNVRRIITAKETAIYYRRFRKESATTRKKSISERLKITHKLICGYTRVYISNLRSIDLLFYISRLCATVKGHLLR